MNRFAPLAAALHAIGAGFIALGDAVGELAPATAEGDSLVALPGPLERRTALALVRAGALPAVRLGRRWYCRASALTALVDSRTAQARGAEPTDDGFGELETRAGRRAA